MNSINHLKGYLRHNYLYMSLVVTVFVTAVCVPFGAYSNDCLEALQNIANQQNSKILLSMEEVSLEGNSVQVVSIKSDREKLKASTMFGTSENLIFGFNKAGHAYVVARGARFDGNLQFRDPIVNLKTDILDEGIFFRIPVSTEALDKVVDHLSKGKSAVGLSCVSASCTFLRKRAEVSVDLPRWSRVLATSVTRELLLNGIKTEDGQKIRIQGYVFNSSVETLMLDFKGTQMSTGISMGIPAVIVFGLLSSSFFHLIHNLLQ